MEYLRFSEASARDYLGEHSPDALRAFRLAREPAMKADLFRLAYLSHNGGFYADADDRCVAPLSGLEAHHCGLVLYQEDLGSIGNNFIGAVPHHPVLADALAQAVDAVNRGSVEMLWLATGPSLVTRALARHLAKGADDFQEALRGTRVLQRCELLKFVSIHCRISYKITRKHWSRTTFLRLPPVARVAAVAPVAQHANTGDALATDGSEVLHSRS